jgi:hypothetical protein
MRPAKPQRRSDGEGIEHRHAIGSQNYLSEGNGMANVTIKGATEKLGKKDLVIDEPQPRNLLRADVAPVDGYSLVVDNRFKSHFATAKEAEASALALKTKYPMLLIQIYDAANKTRSTVDLPKE